MAHEPSMTITVRREARLGAAPKYDAFYALPLDAATTADAESLAAMALKGINRQLDFSKSQYRVAFYERETGRRVKTAPTES